MKLGKRSADVGWQPKVSRVPQVIPDGTLDELLHVAKAMNILHAGCNEIEILHDLKHAVTYVQTKGRASNYDRLAKLNWLKRKALEISEESTKIMDGVSETCRRCLPRLNIVLIELVTKFAGLKDHSLPRTLVLGFPIVGEVPDSPFFETKEVDAKINVEELLETSKARRAKVLANLENFSIERNFA